MKPPTAKTRLLLLLGDPVRHSRSPEIQNAAIEAAALDAVYLALRLERGFVEAMMRSVAGAGGGGNVTLPHKEAAAAALDHASEAVEATGACNLFWWETDRGLCGDNSDVEAFRRAAEHLLEGELRGRRVLVLGAGGAARAVVHACQASGARWTGIVNRTRARARELADRLGGELVVVADAAAAADAGPYDLIVNATSLGLGRTDPLPLDLGPIETRAALDLVYGPSGTAWVRHARETGVRAEDGLRMLVLQAAAGFERWFDREPSLEVMFRASGLDSVVGDRTGG